MKDLKIEVGMIFFLAAGDSRYKSKNGEYQVTKVGRKYFYAAPVGHLTMETKFEKEDNPSYDYFAREVKNFGTRDCLYLNEQTYLNEVEWRKVKRDFDVINFSEEDKEKLRQICRPYLTK